jgi:small GTP-binding protein
MILDDGTELTIKLLIVGDSTVGKTNFVCSIADNNFNENYFASTGVDLKKTSIKINGKTINLQLWDTAGQEKYRSMAKSLFLKAQGIFVLYDITNESSFNDLKNWIDLIKEEGNSDIPIIIVGNKMDLKDKRVVEKEKAMEYAKQQKMDYIETSSLTRENINKAITLLTGKVLKKANSNSNFSFSIDSRSLKKKQKHVCCY